MGDYWTTGMEWEFLLDLDYFSATGLYQYRAKVYTSGQESALSQSISNPLVTPYQGGDYIQTGKTYQVTFNIDALPDSTGTLKVGGYTQPANEIFDELTTLGEKTVIFTAQSDGLSFIAGANSFGWEIRNPSVKQITEADDNFAVVTVEPDATAQSPEIGDFIFFGKDNQIGTAGVTGYYAAIEMKNDSILYSELFAVSLSLIHI